MFCEDPYLNKVEQRILPKLPGVKKLVKNGEIAAGCCKLFSEDPKPITRFLYLVPSKLLNLEALQMARNKPSRNTQEDYKQREFTSV